MAPKPAPAPKKKKPTKPKVVKAPGGRQVAPPKAPPAPMPRLFTDQQLRHDADAYAGGATRRALAGIPTPDTLISQITAPIQRQITDTQGFTSALLGQLKGVGQYSVDATGGLTTAQNADQAAIANAGSAAAIAAGGGPVAATPGAAQTLGQYGANATNAFNASLAAVPAAGQFYTNALLGKQQDAVTAAMAERQAAIDEINAGRPALFQQAYGQAADRNFQQLQGNRNWLIAQSQMGADAAEAANRAAAQMMGLNLEKGRLVETIRHNTNSETIAQQNAETAKARAAAAAKSKSKPNLSKQDEAMRTMRAAIDKNYAGVPGKGPSGQIVVTYTPPKSKLALPGDPPPAPKRITISKKDYPRWRSQFYTQNPGGTIQSALESTTSTRTGRDYNSAINQAMQILDDYNDRYNFGWTRAEIETRARTYANELYKGKYGMSPTPRPTEPPRSYNTPPGRGRGRS